MRYRSTTRSTGTNGNSEGKKTPLPDLRATADSPGKKGSPPVPTRDSRRPGTEAGPGTPTEFGIRTDQVNAPAPAGPDAGAEAGHAEDTPDLAGGNLGEAAAAEAGGLEALAGQERRLSGEELVRLLEVGKGLVVAYVGRKAQLPPDRLAALSNYEPSTRSLLCTFADDAATFLPALNASAPAIGALAFAAIAGFDLFQTSLELRAALRAVSAKKEDTRTAKPAPGVPGGESAGERPAWVKGAESI